LNVIIGFLLFGIVASLGQALYSMSSGQGDPGRMVRALTLRVGLSLLLFVLLMAGWHLGLIEPHSAR
jgi:hypothetical protein